MTDKFIRKWDTADEIKHLADLLQYVQDEIARIKTHHGQHLGINFALPSDGLLAGSIRDLRRIANDLAAAED